MKKSIEPNTYERESFSVERKVVLVVDDNAEILSLNRTVLEIDNIKVFTASSGQEALSILSEINQPDLILLDMQMPDMSGPEFLVILEEKQSDVLKNVPVVFLTAMDRVPVSKAVGCIRKPMDIDKFLEAVHRFIAKGPWLQSA